MAKMKMTTTKDLTFTVQGGDTPVPVGNEVPRTGLTRSSANDCSVPLVGDQAGVHASASGIKEERMDECDFLLKSLGESRHSTPKTSRLTTQRSPPMTVGETKETVETVKQANISFIDLTWDEEEHRSRKKRKRAEVPEATKQEEENEKENKKRRDELAQFFQGLEKEVRRLDKLVSENTNTKKDIKESTAALRAMVALIYTKETMGYIEGHNTNAGKKGRTAEKESQTNETNTETRETATQTEDGETNEPGDYIVKREQILEVKNHEDFKQIRNFEWPEETYVSTKHEAGQVTQTGKETDILVWDEGEDNGSQTRRAMAKHPELRELEGDIAHLYLGVESEDASGKRRKSEQVITKIKTNGSERDCFQQMVRVRERMVEKNRIRVATYPPGTDENGEVFRKMAECVFAGTNIECGVYYQHKTKEPHKRETEAIIVKQEGKTYAELLRSIKIGMGKEDRNITDNINAIRQTKEGAMVITVKTNGDKTHKLRDIISRMENVQTRISTGNKGRRTAIHIKGMDAITTREEIAAAVADEAGVDGELIRIGQTRPFYGSSTAVTAVIPEIGAKKILQKGRIRIAYNWCRVEARVAITQCFKCWRYGHVAATCAEGEDRSKNCKNCGERGHLRKECANGKHCPVCGVEGHSAGTGRCPETRRAIRKAKEEGETNRRSNRKVQKEAMKTTNSMETTSKETRMEVQEPPSTNTISQIKP